jgi:hypothetical protein
LTSADELKSFVLTHEPTYNKDAPFIEIARDGLINYAARS